MLSVNNCLCFGIFIYLHFFCMTKVKGNKMAIEVFNRYEKKYLITDEIYNNLVDYLGEYMHEDIHNRSNDFYSISNIYYDTEDNYLIRHSVDKPIFKEKLRLRSYGQVGLESKVYLEIKKKYNGIVNKRRTILTMKEAGDFITTKIKPLYQPYMNKQVLNEIDYFIHKYDVKPKLYLSYDRRAMFGKEDMNIRITFDTNIRTRRYDVGLEYGSYGELLLDEGSWLMEIKINNGAPLWLSKILSQYKVYPTSFSKYGTEYTKQMID